MSCDGAQLLGTDRGLSERERHRRWQILQINGAPSLIQEGIALSGATVDPQRHAHGMAKFRVVRVHLKHLGQLA